MGHSPKEGRHYRRRDDWTERQRQVLDLLAQGLTNGQIADRLGISLDGAKYHVAEVMRRLGVDTREDAAQYWRAYNRWPARLKRFTGAIVAGAGLRWSGAKGAGIILAGIVVVFLGTIVALAVVVMRDGDEQQPPPVGAEPTVTARPTAATAVTPGTSVPTQPAGGSPTEIGGVPVRQLSLAAEVPFPARAVLFYWRGCYACGQWPFIWRAYVDESGTLINDPITQAPSEEGGIDGVAISPAGGDLFATFCRGYCGGEGESQPGSTKVARLSTDGGVTWEEGKPLPATTFPLFRYQGQWFLSTWDEATRTVQYWAYETGATLEPPANVQGAFPMLLGSGGIAWRQAGSGGTGPPLYFDENGAPLEIWPLDRGDGSLSATPGRETLLATSYPSGPIGSSGPIHLVVEDEAGDVRAALSWKEGWLGHLHLVSPSLVVATAEIPWSLYPPDENPGPPGGEPALDFDVRAVLIDVENASLHPIAGLPRGPDGEWEYPGWYPGHNYTFPRLMVMQEGALLRVATGGSCLNVRERPSTEAPVIRCYVDGVLLTEREANETSDGWLAVKTPDGRQGWVAEEYLAR